MAKFHYWIAIFLLASTARAAPAKIYIHGHWKTAESSGLGSRPPPSILNIGLVSDSRSLVISFLKDNAKTLHTDSEVVWLPARVQKGPQLETYRLEKTWKGLPVVGGESLVQLSKGRVAFANADDTPLESLSERPRLTREEAKQIALASLQDHEALAGDAALLVLISGEESERSATLTYKVTVRGSAFSDNYFIDANSGRLLLVTANVHTAAPRLVLAGNGRVTDFSYDTTKWKTIFTESGCKSETINALASWLTSWWSGDAPSDSLPAPCTEQPPKILESARNAWKNSGLVYDFYLNNHNRNSIDGRGMPLVSVVNFAGPTFANAGWNDEKKLMLYGIREDDKYTDLALPLDIAAHEITHGLTSNTAALAYASESGALNESYSDIFGKIIAFANNRADDWKMGKELFRDGTSFIRDLEDPAVKHVSEQRFKDQTCLPLNDYCAVHSNSGIPTAAAVRIAKENGLEALDRIYYLTLTQLLRSNSSFRDARAQTEAACLTLYGESPICQSVSSAFESVGI